MLKKLSLIIIIAVLAYSQVGYYFVMRHFQHEQKEAIKEKIFSELNDEELEIISLSNDENISWEEDGKEFFFKGEMYDVVKTKTVNGNVMFYCINDKKEKDLVENYNLVTKHNSSTDKKGKDSVDTSFNLFYQDESSNEEYIISILNNFPSFDSRLSENITGKISPPPKA